MQISGQGYPQHEKRKNGYVYDIPSSEVSPITMISSGWGAREDEAKGREEEEAENLSVGVGPAAEGSR